MARNKHNQLKLNKMYNNGFYNYLCSNEFSIIYKLVSQNFMDNNTNSVLDIGCWDGMFYKVLKDQGYSGKYLGFDLSSIAIESANNTYSNVNTKFVVANWDDPPYFGTCDSIYFGGVFYYIEDKPNFIERYINKYSPSIIAIQDIQNTDLSSLDYLGENITNHLFEIDLDVNEERRKRQVKIIKLK